MFKKVTGMFLGRNPRRDASLALARIATLSDMTGLAWQTGVYSERRTHDETRAMLGVWLLPLAEKERPDSVDFHHAIAGVCCDIRSGGIGVLTPIPMESHGFIVAMPNGATEGEGWKFFVTTTRHTTHRPGGWHSIGLRAERVLEIEGTQYRDFMDHVASFAPPAELAAAH